MFKVEPDLPSELTIAETITPTINEAIGNPEYLSMLWTELASLSVVLDEQFVSLEKKSGILLRWYLGLHSLLIAHSLFILGYERAANFLSQTARSAGFVVWATSIVALELYVLYRVSKALVVHTHYAVSLKGVFPEEPGQAIYTDERTYNGSLLVHKWTVAEWNRYVLNFRGYSVRHGQVGLLALALFFIVSLLWMYSQIFL